MTDAGIPVAAINDCFRADAPLPGAHHDARRALQFLRSQAGRLKIDKSRVGAFGGSAGAQIAMLLAFHDDLAQKESCNPVERGSTRLTCVGTSAGQTTMDVGWWIENNPAYDRPHQNFPERFGLSDQKACHAVVADTSALPLISAGDPSIDMTDFMSPDDPAPEEKKLLGWQIHHVQFGMTLKKKLDALGVESHLVYPGLPDRQYPGITEFLIFKLTGRNPAPTTRKGAAIEGGGRDRARDGADSGISGIGTGSESRPGISDWQPVRHRVRLRNVGAQSKPEPSALSPRMTIATEEGTGRRFRMMADSSRIDVNELLRQARAGDDAARDRLFTVCRNYVSVAARAEIASWLRAKVDASDLVQQTLLEAHRGLANFRGETEAEWLGWLRRILANNAADFVRQYHGVEKRRVGREVPLPEPAGSARGAFELADEGETPSQLVMRKELQLQVADALTRLPEDYQEVIILRNMRRLPFDEVAEQMERSRPATQMLWMRAIKRLQEVLEGR
jgi:RNA polymerase sigma-70 factor (ECF subfamily)